MIRRFEMCREKGFDAVEPDNIEAFENNSGFPITAAEQLTYNEWVAEEVHSLGMAVLQKNDVQQTPRTGGLLRRRPHRAVQPVPECEALAPYVAAGKPVLNAEYHLATKKFCARRRVPRLHGRPLCVALKGERFQPCW